MWTDPKVKKLSPEAKLLFCYLITNSHTHLSGIYYLPEMLAGAETGLTQKKLKASIKELSDSGLCRFDRETDVIWVVNMLKYQGRGEKIKKAVENQLASLHACPLIQCFLEHNHTLSIPYRYPIEGVSPQDQDQKKDQMDSGFEEFWKAYPKKKAKIKAQKVWARLKVTATLLEEILAAIDRQKKTPEWQKEGGQFIPHPTTWLNGGCWSDSVEVEKTEAPPEDPNPREKTREIIDRNGDILTMEWQGEMGWQETKRSRP